MILWSDFVRGTSLRERLRIRKLDSSRMLYSVSRTVKMVFLRFDVYTVLPRSYKRETFPAPEHGLLFCGFWLDGDRELSIINKLGEHGYRIC